jgi:hypothetical protein
MRSVHEQKERKALEPAYPQEKHLRLRQKRSPKETSVAGTAA